MSRIKTTGIHNYNQKGFSLVELMITAAVASISLGVGVPSLQSFLQDNYQINAINDFSSYVSYARNEAVIRNTSIKLCIANEQRNGCAAEQNNWANGYLIMAGNEVLKIQDTLPGNQVIEGNSNELVFLSNGMMNSTGQFKFCDESNTGEGRSITINMGSQVRYSKTGIGCPAMAG